MSDTINTKILGRRFNSKNYVCYKNINQFAGLILSVHQKGNVNQCCYI